MDNNEKRNRVTQKNSNKLAQQRNGQEREEAKNDMCQEKLRESERGGGKESIALTKKGKH